MDPAIVERLTSILPSMRKQDLQVILKYAGMDCNGPTPELVTKCTWLVMQNRNVQETVLAMVKSMRHTPTPSPSTSYTYTNVANIQPPKPRPVKLDRDVRYQVLPFYDVLQTIFSPQKLNTMSSRTADKMNILSFQMTPKQSSDIILASYLSTCQEWRIQAQLRFCLASTGSKAEPDAFPRGLLVKVNNRPLKLPDFLPCHYESEIPRRPPKPLDITPLLILSPGTVNNVEVTWTEEQMKQYAVAIYLVEKQKCEKLIERIKARGPEPADNVRAFIRRKLDDSDADVQVAETMRASLMCQVSKRRIRIPIRSFKTCDHVQCFDAETYISMNELRPKWKCPICATEAMFSDLRICGYFSEILESNPRSDDVEFQKDGSWKLISSEAEPVASAAKTGEADKLDDTIPLDSDNDDLDSGATGGVSAAQPTKDATELLPTRSVRAQPDPDVVELSE